MLVLTRLLHESIRIGDDIFVTVTRIDRDKVRLGIEAPESVNIVRCEIDDRPGPGPMGPQAPQGQGPRSLPDPDGPASQGPGGGDQ
jgi:carbon storage regulator